MKLSTKGERILGFDGLRGFAVIAVWLEHRTFLNGSGLGGLGVSLFFVLSGFLIVEIIRGQRVKIETNRSSALAEWKIFVSRRAYRIFPVYYIFLTLVGLFLLMHKGTAINVEAVFMHIFYLVNFWIAFVAKQWNSLTTHLWSLSVEEQFYLIFPIIAFLMPSKYLIHACIFIIGLGVGLGNYFEASNDFKWASNIIFFGFSKIALGGLFVLTVGRGEKQDGNSSAMPFILLLVYLFLPPVAEIFKLNSVNVTLEKIPTTIFVGVILCYVKFNQSSLLVEFLECRFLKYLGKMSYGFYVYHYVISFDLIKKSFNINLNMSIPNFIIIVIEFIVTFFVALLSWKFIEQPIMRRRSA
jgi:peptidoglycan/LPS O-acetylase OafA/YrhL